MAGTDKHSDPGGPKDGRTRPVLIEAFSRAKRFLKPQGVPPYGSDPDGQAGSGLGRRELRGRHDEDRDNSEKHFSVAWVGSRHEIRNLAPQNGTFVEGTELPKERRVSIEDGAILRAGQTMYVYRRALEGDIDPAEPIGTCIGPYGLREASRFLAGLQKYPPNPLNVLIEGPTGTGKEDFARRVADALGKGQRFVTINAAVLDADRCQAELFGYAPHAFTGADPKGKRGLLRDHVGGAVFFDEIGEVPLGLQSKLLRLLQQREIQPLLESPQVLEDVLLIFATNRSLQAEVRDKNFRLDLLERIEARIALPPLDERVEDIPSILLETSGLTAAQIDVEAMEQLMLHSYKGNIRELKRRANMAIRLAESVENAPALRKWAVEEVLAGVTRRRRRAWTQEMIESLAPEDTSGREVARQLGMTHGKVRRTTRKDPAQG